MYITSLPFTISARRKSQHILTSYTYIYIIYACCVPIRNEHKKCLSATVAVYTHYTYPPTLAIVMRSSLQSRRRRQRLRRRHEANLCVRGHWPQRRHSYAVHDDNMGRVIGIYLYIIPMLVLDHE